MKSSRVSPRSLRKLQFLLAVCVAVCCGVVFVQRAGADDADAKEASPKEDGTAIPIHRVEARGRWVMTAEGVPPDPGARRRGLQSSGLVFDRDKLVSIGDQRSEHPGHLLFIDPTTARLLRPPLLPTIDEVSLEGNPEVETYRSIRNSDFEGVCRHPNEPGTFFAVTENKAPWIVEIRARGTDAATFRQFSPLRFPEGLIPWRDDRNFRVEGLAIDDNAETLYLAFERASDHQPRILTISVKAARSGKPLELKGLAIDFGGVPRREDKGRARLNLNGVQFLRRGGRPFLLALARDQERVLLVALDTKRVERIIDLILLSPEGTRIKWVSPEGIALDAQRKRVWVINDPDSVRNNYRTAGSSAADGPFALYTPLLFDLPLYAFLRGEL